MTKQKENQPKTLTKAENEFIRLLFGVKDFNVKVPLSCEAQLSPSMQFDIIQHTLKRNNHIDLDLRTLLLIHVNRMQAIMLFIDDEQTRADVLYISNKRFSADLQKVYEISTGMQTSADFNAVCEKTLSLSLLASFIPEVTRKNVFKTILLSFYQFNVSLDTIRSSLLCEASAIIRNLQTDLRGAEIRLDYDDFTKKLHKFNQTIFTQYTETTKPNPLFSVLPAIILLLGLCGLSSYFGFGISSLLFSVVVSLYTDQRIRLKLTRNLTGETLEHYADFLKFYNYHVLNPKMRGKSSQVRALLDTGDKQRIAKTSVQLHFDVIKRLEFTPIHTNINDNVIYQIKTPKAPGEDRVDFEISDHALLAASNLYNRSKIKTKRNKEEKEDEDKIDNSVNNNNNSNTKILLELSEPQKQNGLLFTRGPRKAYVYTNDEFYGPMIESVFTNNGLFKFPDRIAENCLLAATGEFNGLKLFGEGKAEIKGRPGTGLRVYLDETGEEFVNGKPVPAYTPRSWEQGKN